MSEVKTPINVFIKSVNGPNGESGKTYIVQLNPQDKIEKLIQLAAEKTGSNMKEMRLIYAGKDLSD